MIIYKVTNLIDGKIYIGQTIRSLDARIVAHWYEAGNNRSAYFHNALRKYGLQSFKVEVIDTAEDIATLNEKEQYWIKELNSMAPTGYNMTTGGLNRRLSEETKRKIGVGNKGKCLGRIKGPLAEKTKLKLSLVNKGKQLSEETKRKIGVAHFGKHHTAATKRKQSEAKKGVKNKFFGKHHTVATKQRIAATKRGKQHTIATKKKMATMRKMYWERIHRSVEQS